MVNLTGLDVGADLLAGPLAGQVEVVHQHQTLAQSASFLVVHQALDLAEDPYGHQALGYLVLVEEHQHDLEENFLVALACYPFVQVLALLV